MPELLYRAFWLVIGMILFVLFLGLPVGQATLSGPTFIRLPGIFGILATIAPAFIYIVGFIGLIVATVFTVSSILREL